MCLCVCVSVYVSVCLSVSLCVSLSGYLYLSVPMIYVMTCRLFSVNTELRLIAANAFTGSSVDVLYVGHVAIRYYH
jgi:hypothetical protein